MPTAIEYPRRMERGEFAGRTFKTPASYAKALRELKKERGVNTLYPRRKKRSRSGARAATPPRPQNEFVFKAHHGGVDITVSGALSEKELGTALRAFAAA